MRNNFRVKIPRYNIHWGLGSNLDERKCISLLVCPNAQLLKKKSRVWFLGRGRGRLWKLPWNGRSGKLLVIITHTISVQSQQKIHTIVQCLWKIWMIFYLSEECKWMLGMMYSYDLLPRKHCTLWSVADVPWSSSGQCYSKHTQLLSAAAVTKGYPIYYMDHMYYI